MSGTMIECADCGTHVQASLLTQHKEDSCTNEDTQSVCGLDEQREFLQENLANADAWAAEMQDTVQHPTNESRVKKFRYELGKLKRRAETLAQSDREPLNATEANHED